MKEYLTGQGAINNASL